MRLMSVGMWWDMIFGDGGNEGGYFGERRIGEGFRGL